MAIKLADDCWAYENFDVIYSQDDGGWYASDLSGQTTAVFATRQEAVRAAAREEWDRASFELEPHTSDYVPYQ